AAIALFDSVNSANSGMVQSGCRASFAQEAFEGLAVALIFFGNKFKRDAAAELGVFGLIDDTHAPRAEFSENPIVGDSLVNHDLGLQNDVRRSGKFGQCEPRGR